MAELNEKEQKTLDELLGKMDEKELIALGMRAAKGLAEKKEWDKETAKSIENTFKTIVSLGAEQVACIEKIAKTSPSAKPQELKYLPNYFDQLTKGETIRINKIEQPWVRAAMLKLNNASYDAGTYMYHYQRASVDQQGKIGVIMEGFAKITKEAGDISKAARSATPKRKPKQKLRKEKIASKEEKKEEIGVSEAKA